MCAYRKAILKIGMQLHAMSLGTIWSISFPLGNKQMPVSYFFFTSKSAIKLQFINKISVSSPVFHWKYYDESETAKCTRSNVNKGMRFASDKIKSASLIH